MLQENKIGRTKTLSQKKWVKWGLIPGLLLGVWLIFTVWYIVQFDQSLLVLSYNHSNNNITSLSHNKLTKGQKITGEFTAVANDLGIVAIRFQSFQRIPYKDEDILVFRLKQKGAKDWYYQNQYRSGLTYDVPFLPFGFPIINNSKGRIYDFELESLNGNQLNSVALSYREPLLVSKYQENKHQLLTHPQQLLHFALRKFVNAFQTIDILYSSFVFALPLLFYLFWISPAKTSLIDPPAAYLTNLIERSSRRALGKYYKNVYALGRVILLYNLIFILLLIVLIDVLFLQILNDLLYITVSILWVILLRAYRIKCKFSFATGITFLCFAPILLQLNIANSAEKAASWAFIFFAVGLIQAIFAIRKNRCQ